MYVLDILFKTSQQSILALLYFTLCPSGLWTHTHTASFRLLDVYFWLDPADLRHQQKIRGWRREARVGVSDFPPALAVPGLSTTSASVRQPSATALQLQPPLVSGLIPFYHFSSISVNSFIFSKCLS